MLLLGFDTSSSIASIALADSQRILAEIALPIERTHMETLIPGIRQVLKNAKKPVQDIGGVVVGTGAGSFTGTRIGVVVAKTLGQALHVPVAGIASLDALAYQTEGERRFVAVAVDAKRGEVYTATYRFQKNEQERLTDYRAIDPALLARELAAGKERVVLIGDGLKKYQEIFREILQSNLIQTKSESWYPKASSLIALAREKMKRIKWEDLFQLIPIYVRLPDTGGK